MLRRLCRLMLLLLAAVLISGGCGVPKNKFRLDGKFRHLRSADIFVYADDIYDTLHIRDGKFSFEYTLTEPKIITILYPDFSERKIIAEPGKKARFSTDAEDLSGTSVKGTEENELLSGFYSDISSLHGAQIQDRAAKFIASHPASLAAEAVFRAFVLSADKVSGAKALPLLEQMQKARRGDRRMTALAASLRPRLATLPGAKAPAFTVHTWDGRDISSASLRGRWLLISFWATWQYDSFSRIRSLRGIARPYGQRLSLVNVCLDVDTRSFRNTLRRDTIPGYNVCDRQAWHSPLVRIFGIASIPDAVLISPDGVITERGITGNDLAARLSKHLSL